MAIRDGPYRYGKPYTPIPPTPRVTPSPTGADRYTPPRPAYTPQPTYKPPPVYTSLPPQSTPPSREVYAPYAPPPTPLLPWGAQPVQVGAGQLNQIGPEYTLVDFGAGARQINPLEGYGGAHFTPAGEYVPWWQDRGWRSEQDALSGFTPQQIYGNGFDNASNLFDFIMGHGPGGGGAGGGGYSGVGVGNYGAPGIPNVPAPNMGLPVPVPGLTPAPVVGAPPVAAPAPWTMPAIPARGGPYAGINVPEEYMAFLPEWQRAPAGLALSSFLSGQGYSPAGVYGRYGETSFTRPGGPGPIYFGPEAFSMITDPTLRAWLQWIMGEQGFTTRTAYPGEAPVLS